jgi:hypothetical protein
MDENSSFTKRICPNSIKDKNAKAENGRWCKKKKCPVIYYFYTIYHSLLLHPFNSLTKIAGLICYNLIQFVHFRLWV